MNREFNDGICATKDEVRLKINNIRVYFGFASATVEYSIFFPPKSTLTANGVISRHRFACDSSRIAFSSSLDHLGVASHLRDEDYFNVA